jgi:hypothetical protein
MRLGAGRSSFSAESSVKGNALRGHSGTLAQPSDD